MAEVKKIKRGLRVGITSNGYQVMAMANSCKAYNAGLIQETICNYYY